jgi:hypothetical protein
VPGEATRARVNPEGELRRTLWLRKLSGLLTRTFTQRTFFLFEPTRSKGIADFEGMKWPKGTFSPGFE